MMLSTIKLKNEERETNEKQTNFKSMVSKHQNQQFITITIFNFCFKIIQKNTDGINCLVWERKTKGEKKSN